MLRLALEGGYRPDSFLAVFCRVVGGGIRLDFPGVNPEERYLPGVGIGDGLVNEG